MSYEIIKNKQLPGRSGGRANIIGISVWPWRTA